MLQKEKLPWEHGNERGAPESNVNYPFLFLMFHRRICACHIFLNTNLMQLLCQTETFPRRYIKKKGKTF